MTEIRLIAKCRRIALRPFAPLIELDMVGTDWLGVAGAGRQVIEGLHD